jgi:hypothetical protein
MYVQTCRSIRPNIRSRKLALRCVAKDINFIHSHQNRKSHLKIGKYDIRNIEFIGAVVTLRLPHAQNLELQQTYNIFQAG